MFSAGKVLDRASGLLRLQRIRAPGSAVIYKFKERYRVQEGFMVLLGDFPDPSKRLTCGILWGSKSPKRSTS